VTDLDAENRKAFAVKVVETFAVPAEMLAHEPDPAAAERVRRELAEALDAREIAREARRGPAAECGCGHLLPSHRAAGCVALTQPDQRGQATGYGLCPCREFRGRA